MGTIAPPPEKLPETEDPSYTFLLAWKESFETLYKNDIKVFIKEDDAGLFHHMFDLYVYPKTPHGIGHRHDYGNAELFILLPEFCGLEFLVGLKFDKMYSDREILSDPFLHDESALDCKPETKKWEVFYKEVHKECEVYKDRIPPPLKPPTQDY